MKFINVLVASVFAAFTMVFMKQKINYLLMNFFRNLGRYKIRKSKKFKDKLCIDLLIHLIHFYLDVS